MTITINTEYLKSWNSIFKILQLVLGAICVGIIGNEFNITTKIPISYVNIITVSTIPQVFFLVVTCTFFVGTSILFISYLISPSAASIVPKTIYELIYHSIATILLLAASIAFMVQIHRKDILFLHYNSLLAASICCLLNTILYGASSINSFSTYGDD